MQISFTDRVLPTIRRRDKTGSETVSPHSLQNYSSLRVYFVIVQIPPFIFWTCSAWQREVGGHSWDDTKDLLCSCTVFDDTEFAKLVQSVFSHFAYSDAAMWPKSIQHQKNAIFMQKFAKTMTPVTFLYHHFLLSLSLFLLFLFVVIVVAAVVIYKLNFLKKKVYLDTFVSRVCWKTHQLLLLFLHFHHADHDPHPHHKLINLMINITLQKRKKELLQWPWTQQS